MTVPYTTNVWSKIQDHRQNFSRPKLRTDSFRPRMPLASWCTVTVSCSWVFYWIFGIRSFVPCHFRSSFGPLALLRATCGEPVALRNLLILLFTQLRSLEKMDKLTIRERFPCPDLGCFIHRACSASAVTKRRKWCILKSLLTGVLRCKIWPRELNTLSVQAKSL